jgi:hypothetical protein
MPRSLAAGSPFPAMLPLRAAAKPAPEVLDTLEHMFEHKAWWPLAVVLAPL